MINSLEMLFCYSMLDERFTNLLAVEDGINSM